MKKRVNNNSSLSIDQFTVEKATKMAADELFGKIGQKNVQVKFWKNGILTLSIPRSIWRNEISLVKGKLLFRINEIIKQKVVRFIKIQK